MHLSEHYCSVMWCCSVLQCVAVCCSVLQYVVIHAEYVYVNIIPHILQCVAVCCSVLQRNVMNYSMLQCVWGGDGVG